MRWVNLATAPLRMLWDGCQCCADFRSVAQQRTGSSEGSYVGKRRVRRCSGVARCMAKIASRADLNPSAAAEFFQFLQCSLRLEAAEKLQHDMLLEDQEALTMWPSFKLWASRNLKREKWVPFHTALSPHELFAVEKIHHNQDLSWTPFQRYLAMIIFRAHCQKHVFSEAQLPYLQTPEFWAAPKKYFEDDGPITQAMLRYRRETRSPLQTSAFRLIPKRLCKDNDENLAVSVARRSQLLIDIANEVWPLLLDVHLPSAQKFAAISRAIQTGHGFGETWAKMLMVSMDIAYPEAKLLMEHCDVGIGAKRGLLRLGGGDNRAGLQQVTEALNGAQLESARHFWRLLAKVESVAHSTFDHLPLIQRHLDTERLSPATVQVQLCEWRQFLDYLDRQARLELLQVPSSITFLDDDAGPPQISDEEVSEIEVSDDTASDAIIHRAKARRRSTSESMASASAAYLTRASEVLGHARVQHEELLLKIEVCAEELREYDLRWDIAKQEFLKMARLEQQLQYDIWEAKIKVSQERTAQEPLQKHVKALGDALCTLEQQQPKLPGPAVPSCLAERSHDALAQQLAQLQQGIQEIRAEKLCAEKAAGVKTCTQHEDETWQVLQRLQNQQALTQAQRSIAGEEMQKAEAARVSAQNELLQRRLRLVHLKADISALEAMVAPQEKHPSAHDTELFSPCVAQVALLPSCGPSSCYLGMAARVLRALALLLLGCGAWTFLAPVPAPVEVPLVQWNAVDAHLLLAEIDMENPTRPEDDEPTSPANALILLTLGFVFAAFILPLLFAGIQSKNADIAGADERGKADLLKNLCSELQKDAFAGTLIKKLVGEHWLEKVEDLRYVPQHRLESWGVPLKLIDEIYDFLAENAAWIAVDEADEGAHNVNAYMNYTLRPAMQSYLTPSITFSKLRDDAEKRRQPQTWAAKRLQRWFRHRQQQRARKPVITEDQVLSWLEDDDFRTPDAGKSQDIREKRAMESLKKGVVRWRARKAREKAEGLNGPQKKPLPADPFLAKIVETSPNTIPAFLAQRAAATPRDCEVYQLFIQFGNSLHQSEEEMRPYVHRLVTINWIEEKEDLSLVEDRHWDAWAIPEKLVVLAKLEAGKTGGPKKNFRENGHVVAFLKSWMPKTAKTRSNVDALLAPSRHGPTAPRAACAALRVQPGREAAQPLPTVA
eukprot:s3_g4.t1